MAAGPDGIGRGQGDQQSPQEADRADQFYQLLELLGQPCWTKVVVAQSTGLRAEEVLALE